MAQVETWFEGRQNQEDKDSLRKLEVVLIRKYPHYHDGPYPLHSDYADHLLQCKINTMKWFNDEYHGQPFGIMIGDSIGAQARDRMQAVPARLNFCHGGFLIQDMVQLFADILKFIQANNLPIPSFIVVGTPGGNNLLQRNEMIVTIASWIAFLNLIRGILPKVRIVQYGLPATIVSWMIAQKPAVMRACTDWAKTDGNSAVLLLIKGFVKTNRILPKADESSDGVHMTPIAQLRFDDDVKAGIHSVGFVVVP